METNKVLDWIVLIGTQSSKCSCEEETHTYVVYIPEHTGWLASE